MRMRIVGGTLSGRRFDGPMSDATRPTPERVREGIANALQARGLIAGSRVLDLFAGTGALGFEMLSRGASSLVAVDRSRVVIAAIKRAAEQLALDSRTRVLSLDLFGVPVGVADRLASETAADGPFELVLVDAPYKDVGQIPNLLVALARRGVTSNEAAFVIEHPKKHVVDLTGGLATIGVYRYGDTAVSVVRPTEVPRESTDS